MHALTFTHVETYTTPLCISSSSSWLLVPNISFTLSLICFLSHVAQVCKYYSHFTPCTYLYPLFQRIVPYTQNPISPLVPFYLTKYSLLIIHFFNLLTCFFIHSLIHLLYSLCDGVSAIFLGLFHFQNTLLVINLFSL